MLIIEDPRVTLKEEGHYFPKGYEKVGGIEWSINSVVRDEDGNQHWIDIAILGYPRNVLGGTEESFDISMLAVRSEEGKVVQSKNTVFKIADFPNIPPVVIGLHKLYSLTVTESKDQVVVEVANARCICKTDGSWHFTIEDKEKGIKAEIIHYGVGYPMWYNDKKTLEEYTPNSVGGGYYWAGAVEGTLTMDGRTMKLKGKGARQRYYAQTYSSEEVGAWHDWPYFHFDEVFGSLDEMKLNGHKVMGLYLVDEKQYFSDGSFSIEHHDWAYLPDFRAFIPTHYKMTIEVEAGTLEVFADTVGAYVWANTDVPDCPFAMLDQDNLQGTFTYKDGRKKTLTNGVGGNMVRQWRPYPSMNMLDMLTIK